MTSHERGKRRASLALAVCVIFFASACGGAMNQAGDVGVGRKTTEPMHAIWNFGVDNTTWAEAVNSDRRPTIAAAEIIQLDSVTGQPSLPVEIAPRALESPAPLLIVSSWQGHRFHPETVRLLSANPSALALAAARVAHRVEIDDPWGIVFDLEQQAPTDLPGTLAAIRAIRDSARARLRDLRTVVILPAGDTVAYPARPFAQLADFEIITFTDERTNASAPGPLITVDRMSRMLGRRVADVGPTRLVVAFPAYGYVWRHDQPAQAVTLGAARQLATQANVDVIRDPAFYSLHAIHARDWELWIGDGELQRRLESAAAALGVTTVAEWGARFADRR